MVSRAPTIPPPQAEQRMPDDGGRARLEPFQVTITEAARLLAYDASTIRRLIARGELPAVGEGRLRRIPVQGDERQ